MWHELCGMSHYLKQIEISNTDVRQNEIYYIILDITYIHIHYQTQTHLVSHFLAILALGMVQLWPLHRKEASDPCQNMGLSAQVLDRDCYSWFVGLL